MNRCDHTTIKIFFYLIFFLIKSRNYMFSRLSLDIKWLLAQRSCSSLQSYTVPGFVSRKSLLLIFSNHSLLVISKLFFRAISVFLPEFQLPNKETLRFLLSRFAGRRSQAGRFPVAVVGAVCDCELRTLVVCTVVGSAACESLSCFCLSFSTSVFVLFSAAGKSHSQISLITDF